jgi:hypothetical protein
MKQRKENHEVCETELRLRQKRSEDTYISQVEKGRIMRVNPKPNLSQIEGDRE